MKNKSILFTGLLLGLFSIEKANAVPPLPCPWDITYDDLRALKEEGSMSGKYKHCRVTHQDEGFKITEKGKMGSFVNEGSNPPEKCNYKLTEDHRDYYMTLNCERGG